MTDTKRFLKFRWLAGDINWIDHGGSWYAGPYKSGGGVADYTYFFKLEWLPYDFDADGPGGSGGFATLRVIVPSHWSAHSLRGVFQDWDDNWDDACAHPPLLEALPVSKKIFDLATFLYWDSIPSHTIFDEGVKTKQGRVLALAKAKRVATEASMMLGFYIDRNQGWQRIAGNMPVPGVGPDKFEMKSAAQLAIVLALHPETSEDTLEWYSDLGDQDAAGTYKTLGWASQLWLESWFRKNIDAYTAGKKKR